MRDRALTLSGSSTIMVIEIWRYRWAALNEFLQCPPFRLSYKGLGEPLCFVAFGPLATTAFYLCHARYVAHKTPEYLYRSSTLEHSHVHNREEFPNHKPERVESLSLDGHLKTLRRRISIFYGERVVNVTVLFYSLRCFELEVSGIFVILMLSDIQSDLKQWRRGFASDPDGTGR